MATITSFRPDGTLVWSNALSGTNYMVQTATSLLAGTIWVDYVQLPVTSAVNTNLIFDFNPPAGMALVPAGSFTMGDTLDGEGDAIPTVSATISAFYMDTNLMSGSLWRSVYTYATNNGYGFDNPGAGSSTKYPVNSVNWYDCVKWCNARSRQAGMTPVYFTDAAMTRVYTNGDVDAVYVNWSGQGYRLPTEAEWEKAARGGLVGQRFPWGGTISWSQANYTGDPHDLAYDHANAAGYDPQFGGDTSPVGSFAANGYGLNDMAGNVDEWCWDWYGTPYGQPTTTNPTGPAAGSGRVLRGGNWGNGAFDARCAFRDPNYAVPPTSTYYFVGFRCVRGH